MNREPISCRAVNALTARLETFAARKVRVFKRAVFNLAAYFANNLRVNQSARAESTIQLCGIYGRYRPCSPGHSKVDVNITPHAQS